MLSNEKCVSKFPVAIVGNFIPANTDPLAFSITALMKQSASTPCRVAIANASDKACTVHAEIKFVASFTTVAVPTPPHGKVAREVTFRNPSNLSTSAGSPPV
jgi:hypothetical protein